jgi:hypothetical protein
MSEASAEDLFRDLRLLVARGALRLELDFARLDHIDSPVAVEADSNIWVYVSIVVCAAIFWRAGTWPGVAAVAISLALYLTLGRRYVRRRLARRVHERALADGEVWRRLWRFGGVALIDDEGGRCAAPDGNWMALVRRRATCSAADC